MWNLPGPGIEPVSSALTERKEKKNVAQSCLTLCDPMSCRPPGSPVHGILQARRLEWVAISFSRGTFWPRDWTRVSCISGRFFTISATIKWGLHSDWNHLKESRINGQCLLPLRSEVGVYWWGGRLIHFTLFSYCSIFDLQCCISFTCTAKWFSYTYTYIFPFSNSFPI